jgi:hypothetical protein
MNKETKEKIYNIIRVVQMDNLDASRSNKDVSHTFGELYEAVHESEYEKIVQASKDLDEKLGCNIAGVIGEELEKIK